MKTLFASISENVQFVLLCLAVTAAVVLLAWGGERLVMKKRHRLTPRTPSRPSGCWRQFRAF